MAERADRSRSPLRGAERESGEVAAGEASEAVVPAPASWPPLYLSIDVSTWKLESKGRNKFGGVNWNVRPGPRPHATTFKFHMNPGDYAGDDYDAWSTNPWEVKAERQDGTPDNKMKFQIEVNERQLAWVAGVEEQLISLCAEHSMEMLNLKQPLSREMIASQHFRSLIKPASETRAAKVTFTLMVAQRDKLGVMHYFRRSPDGSSYQEPVALSGWEQIQPLIEGHYLRGAKVRISVARTWALHVIKKEIYPSFEILEMYVKEPENRRNASSSLNQESKMNLLALM